VSRYRIEHITTYDYEGDVSASYGLFHLRPRDLSWQSCLAHQVRVEPVPGDLYGHVDLYGNTTSYFHVTSSHRQLKVSAVSTVEVREQAMDPIAAATPWEHARPSTRPDQPDAWQALDFTFASPMVEIPDDVREYARRSFPPGRPVGEAATELMHRIYADFTYQSGSTSVSTRVGTLLQRRTGVCQDFAHFMVAGLRSLGLAGQYVSGYLATSPPPGKPRLVGADASHAWVACWIPGGGWLHLDPTNNRLTSQTHATLAWGRDYADVPPVKGVIFTESRKSRMVVSVDMAPAD
jgi:transglutaminase-like putative cysteine protease